MFKFEIGELVEFKRPFSAQRRPRLPFEIIRPPTVRDLLTGDLESCLMIGKMGIVTAKYPSQKPGDTAFPKIPFDRENMYIVYFQEEMSEFLCFEAELEEP